MAGKPHLTDDERILARFPRELALLRRAINRDRARQDEHEVVIHLYSDCSGSIEIEPGGPLRSPIKLGAFADPHGGLKLLRQQVKRFLDEGNRGRGLEDDEDDP